MKKSLWLYGFMLFFGVKSLALFEPPVGQALKSLPVQDGGRIKPFDSFAREVLEVVYGRQSLQGREAYEVVLTWILSPEAWREKELFEVRNHEVLKGLELPQDRKHFRGEEIFGKERFLLLRQELSEKRESKEKLTPYFQALERLENQYYLFTELTTGRYLRIYPDPKSTQWKAIAELPKEGQDLFLPISRKFVERLSAMTGGGGESQEKVIQIEREMDEAVLAFQSWAQKQSPENYGDPQKSRLEVHYNDFHPFRWSYVFFIFAIVILLFLWTTNRSQGMSLVWAMTAVGLGLQLYGFGLRIYLSGRAPVANMYETVVWVAFGALVFSLILEAIYKSKFILLAGLITSVFALVVADTAPAILNPSLQPLEAVLRSNYWLTVHVMTITISYAAFFLAFILGDIALIYYLRDETRHKEKIKSIVLAIYRSMQIGISFLAPGIILGGIWADESWGRFWGWDPKETWALIVLLGYIAVLHGRLVGWIRDFGMVVSSVATFSLVIMAWYGVNFWLGAGLHSYGFGAGGVEYVSGFVLLHILFTIYVAVFRKSKTA